jgi:hypothetical protein
MPSFATRERRKKGKKLGDLRKVKPGASSTDAPPTHHDIKAKNKYDEEKTRNDVLVLAKENVVNNLRHLDAAKV